MRLPGRLSHSNPVEVEPTATAADHDPGGPDAGPRSLPPYAGLLLDPPQGPAWLATATKPRCLGCFTLIDEGANGGSDVEGPPSQSATSGPVVYFRYQIACGLSVAGMFSCGGVGGWVWSASSNPQARPTSPRFLASATDDGSLASAA